MEENDKKMEEMNLMIDNYSSMLTCAKIIEESYRKGAIDKYDVREACNMLKAAYNVGGVEITLLKVRAGCIKQRLDELRVKNYIM
jgi:hypothetical protein